MKSKRYFFLIPESLSIKKHRYSRDLHREKQAAVITFCSLFLQEFLALVKELNVKYILNKRTGFTSEITLKCLLRKLYPYIRLLHRIHRFKNDKILKNCQKEIIKFKQELAQAFCPERFFI